MGCDGLPAASCQLHCPRPVSMHTPHAHAHTHTHSRSTHKMKAKVGSASKERLQRTEQSLLPAISCRVPSKSFGQLESLPQLQSLRLRSHSLPIRSHSLSPLWPCARAVNKKCHSAWECAAVAVAVGGRHWKAARAAQAATP